MIYKVGKCLLRQHRRRKRWSQQELANRIQKSKQTVSRWEKNLDKMSFESAVIVSKAVDCQMEELYEIIEVEE